jgi:hypothetical protein
MQQRSLEDYECKMELVMTMNEAVAVFVNCYIDDCPKTLRSQKLKVMSPVVSDEIQTKDIPNHEC